MTVTSLVSPDTLVREVSATLETSGDVTDVADVLLGNAGGQYVQAERTCMAVGVAGLASRDRLSPGFGREGFEQPQQG